MNQAVAPPAWGRPAYPSMHPDHHPGAPGPSRGLVLAAFAAVYVFWGSTYLGIRVALESLPPLLMGGSRFFLAGLVLLGVAWWRGAPRPSRRQWAHAFLAGGLLILGGNGGVTLAEQYVPSGLAALVVASTPLWMVLLDWALPGGRRPAVKVFAGLALGFAGLLWLVGYRGGAMGEAIHDGGLLLLLAAAVSWALGSVVNRRLDRPASPFLAVALQMMAGGALQVATGTALGEWGRWNPAAVTARSFWAWAYLLVFGSLVGFTAYVWLLQVSSAARVSTNAYVNPLIAVLLGCTLGREVFQAHWLGAGLLILLAVVLIVREGRPGPRPALRSVSLPNPAPRET